MNQRQIATLHSVRLFFACNREIVCFYNSCQKMLTGSNLPQAESSQIPHDQHILSQYAALYAGPPVYNWPGSSNLAHLLNNSPPNSGGPSTFPRSLTSPPAVMRSLQAPEQKETHIPRAQARPEILIKICDTISSQLDHWYQVLDFTLAAKSLVAKNWQI